MDTTETTAQKYIKITLTRRAPVRLAEAEWPLIAWDERSWHDGEVECQANRTWYARIAVRRHDDGRAVVYGQYRYDSSWSHEVDVSAKAGFVASPGADLAELIGSVADDLVQHAADERGERMIREVRDGAIADLPPETI